MSSVPTKMSPSELIAQLRGVAIGEPLPASLRTGEVKSADGRQTATAAPTEQGLARLKSLLSPAAKPTAPSRPPEEVTKATPMGDIKLSPPQAAPAQSIVGEAEPLPDDIMILNKGTGELRGASHLEALFERVESLLGGASEVKQGFMPRVPTKASAQKGVGLAKITLMVWLSIFSTLMSL